MKKILLISILLAALLAACGPQGTPTLSAADVQGTAVAAAWTMVAMTEAAIPTATPIPPTDTPSPTLPPTATPPPISSPLPTAFPTQNASGTDTCVHPLNMAEAGPKKRVRIENDSGGSLNLSLNLYQINAFGQCGALSYANIGKNDTRIVELPAGFWFAYAWISLKGGSSSEAAGSFEIPRGSDDLLRIVIDKDVIHLKGP